jgi:subtilisin-like proprotein convertase family protein
MRRLALLFVVAAAWPMAIGVSAAPAAEDAAGTDVVDEAPGDVGIIAVGSATSTGAGIVRTFYDKDHLNGTYESLAATFYPYGASKVGDGVRLATGDFDGDGNAELVTAAGANLPVLVFDLASDATPAGQLMSIGGFKKGAYVATGDVNGDGISELIIGSGKGAAPKVVIRTDTTDSGLPSTSVDTLQPYPAAFTGGVTVAAGNVDNTGGAEVVTSQASGGGQVKVWHDGNANNKISDEPLQDSFRPYGNTFTGGVFVASGQIQNAGSNGAEVITGPASGKKKVVIRVDANSNGKVSDDPVFDSAFAYGSSYAGGVRVGAGDSDGSGTFVEVHTVPGTAAGSQPLKIFDDTGDVGSLLFDNPPTDTRVSMPSSVKAGAFVAFGKVVSASYAYTGFPVSIPDTATVQVKIVVPKNAGIIEDLDVGIDLFHSFDGDLDVTLTHATTGTSLILWQDVGGSNEGFEIRLNDEAGTDITSASNPKLDGPIVGSYNPQGGGVLSIFDGQDASGTWILTITDDTMNDTGVLFDWDLNVSF